ncbi:Fis family transcriptional regulator [Jannaschia sp. R86511]|uniref:Fis family transcriptional regulator n=1 Tax=Jannaschia sp. R86511 TaxID=3093853 RepID=UPI0036D2AAD6
MHQTLRARLDAESSTLVIDNLAINDAGVVAEARRWSSGSRGDVVALEAITEADLAPFVRQALGVGAAAIAVAGNAQDTFDLERLVTEVGTRTSNASSEAAALTAKAVVDASRTMTAASELARKSIADADVETRRSFQETVTTAQSTLRGELERLFGGENPELVARLQPLLATFATDLDAKVSLQTGELLAKAARQFDPSDPTSPMAKHSAALTLQQQSLAQSLEKHHEALAGKVDELATAVKVQTAARHATSKTASVTPLKGASYADDVHAVMATIAAGLGDEYTDTGAIAGNIFRSKKGDGLLTVGDAGARVVLEMSDSQRPNWNGYLDEAERNRAAGASLGLVPTAEQNAGQSIRVLSARRIVMAFDPVSGDPDLLRTVVMLLRTASVTAAARSGANEIATAEEKLTEALELLSRIDDIQKTATAIHKSATKINLECDSFATNIQRLLNQALAALAGAESEDVGSIGPAAQLASGAA